MNNSGSGPDGRLAITSPLLVSITWMVSSSPTATRQYLSSLVSSMPRGRWPTLMVLTVSILSVSITLTVLLFSFDTYAVKAFAGPIRPITIPSVSTVARCLLVRTDRNTFMVQPLLEFALGFGTIIAECIECRELVQESLLRRNGHDGP